MRLMVIMALLAGLSVVLRAPSAMAQEPIGQYSCAGGAGALRMQGTLMIERWYTLRSYRYYGRFGDAAGNLHEFEVFSPGESGTGSTWTNSMRHRETFIGFQLLQKGFVIRTEDGVVAQFQCQ